MESKIEKNVLWGCDEKSDSREKKLTTKFSDEERLVKKTCDEKMPSDSNEEADVDRDDADGDEILENLWMGQEMKKTLFDDETKEVLFEMEEEKERIEVTENLFLPSFSCRRWNCCYSLVVYLHSSDLPDLESNSESWTNWISFHTLNQT